MAKELVVYFSVYGTAKLVAEEIAKQTGADIATIKNRGTIKVFERNSR